MSIDLAAQLRQDLAPLRPCVHQATGMLTVQLGLDIESAFGRLVAHAAVHGLRLSDVADDIVERRLRLGDDLAVSS